MEDKWVKRKWGTLLEKYVDTPTSYLEIGLYKGKSLPLWHNYLGPLCSIYGIDLCLKQLEIDKTDYNLYEMNSLDTNAFNTNIKHHTFDIIVDDANPHQHSKVFDLYSPLLSKNGTFLIETFKTRIQYFNDYKYLLTKQDFQVTQIRHSNNLEYSLCVKRK